MIPVTDSARDRSLPLLTLAFILGNGIAFFFQLSLPSSALDTLILRWGVVPLRQSLALQAAPGAIDVWLVPLFTSMFLHGGWLHLLGNMLFLWAFGPAVEQYLGRGTFVILYVASGILAAQAQIVLDPGSPIPMIGASGAIAGVLGAYLLLFPLARVTVLLPVFFLPLLFQVPALFFLGLWFLEQFFLGALVALSPAAAQAAGIAFWAHVGGFLSGVLLAIVLLAWRRRDPTRRRNLGRGAQRRTLPTHADDELPGPWRAGQPW